MLVLRHYQGDRLYVYNVSAVHSLRDAGNASLGQQNWAGLACTLIGDYTYVALSHKEPSLLILHRLIRLVWQSLTSSLDTLLSFPSAYQIGSYSTETYCSSLTGTQLLARTHSCRSACLAARSVRRECCSPLPLNTVLTLTQLVYRCSYFGIRRTQATCSSIRLCEQSAKRRPAVAMREDAIPLYWSDLLWYTRLYLLTRVRVCNSALICHRHRTASLFPLYDNWTVIFSFHI